MAAPIDTFVDPDIAGASGAGTVGDPYGDIQHSLDTVTRNTTSGDRILVKAGTDEILAGVLSLATYGTPTFDAPLIFEGYTSAADDGGIGGINGNDGDFQVHGGATAVHWLRMHLHNTGTASVVTLGLRTSINSCEVNNCSGSGIVISAGEAIVQANNIHDISGKGIDVTAAVPFLIASNYLTNGAKDFSTAIEGQSGAVNGIISRNIISIDGTSIGISTASGRGTVLFNSILSAGGTGIGIKFDATSKLNSSLHSNLVEGFSGTGGIGIQIPTGTRQMITYGLNAVFNNATQYDVDAADVVDPLGDNETTSISPFAKSGADTFANRFVYFAPVDTGNVFGGGFN